MLRFVRWITLALIVLLLVGGGTIWLAQSGKSPLAAALVRQTAALVGVTPTRTAAGGVVLPGGAPLGGPFHLIDDQGGSVTDQTYRGQWMLLYFGYTFCPDVCPTELQTIATALHLLGARGKPIVPLFVTIDPARDTPAVLARYVKLFSPRLVGLTGSSKQIAGIARDYRVYYAKVPQTNGPYLMDHSSFIYLMGPHGHFRAFFPPGTSAADLSRQIGSAMNQPG